MKNRIKKVLINLIPIQSLRHKLRKKFRGSPKVDNHGKNNVIKVPSISNLVLRVYGENNVIDIDPKANLNGIIEIYGNNNTIKIGEGSYTLSLYIGVPDCSVLGCTFTLGSRGLINGAVIRLAEDHSAIQIGDDCLFSDQINIWNSDTHSILDKSGHVLNLGEKIVIGDHVWIGCRATVLKNTTIPDNCVVAWGSIVTKRFDEPGCALAGNPAKIVKKGIFWDKERPNNLRRNS